MKHDGLNSLKYEVLEVTNYKLYTHILTTINISDSAFTEPKHFIPDDEYIFPKQTYFYLSPFLLLFLTIFTGGLLATIIYICKRLLCTSIYKKFIS